MQKVSLFISFMVRALWLTGYKDSIISRNYRFQTGSDAFYPKTKTLSEKSSTALEILITTACGKPPPERESRRNDEEPAVQGAGVGCSNGKAKDHFREVTKMVRTYLEGRFYFFLGSFGEDFSILFSSEATRRSSFLMSSAGGSSSGRIPRLPSISLTL